MFSDYLTTQERVACMKAGALSYAGMLDAELGPLQQGQTKQAGWGDVASTGLGLGVEGAKTLWVLAAAGAGIPIGVFSHIIGRRIAGKHLREEELKEKIRLYQNAADEMASGLGGAS